MYHYLQGTPDDRRPLGRHEKRPTYSMQIQPIGERFVVTISALRICAAGKTPDEAISRGCQAIAAVCMAEEEAKKAEKRTWLARRRRRGTHS